jgi:hypothetical protein
VENLNPWRQSNFSTAWMRDDPRVDEVVQRHVGAVIEAQAIEA